MSSIYDISGTSSDSFSLNGKCTLLQGDNPPQAYQGLDGDVYFQSNGTIYAKRNGTWLNLTSTSLPDADSGSNQFVITNGENYELYDLPVTNIAFKSTENTFTNNNTFNQNITVNGIANINNLNVTNSTSLKNTNVNGNLTTSGTLTSNGNTVLKNTNVNGNLTTSGTLTSSNQFILNGYLKGQDISNQTLNANTLWIKINNGFKIYYTTSDGATAKISNLPNKSSTFLESRTVRYINDTDYLVNQICYQRNMVYQRTCTNGTWTGWYRIDGSNLVHKDGNETINGVKTFTSVIQGTAYRAYWGDLAEYYETDEEYPKGTLVKFGGNKEITIADNEVNAVITSTPGFILNSEMTNGQAIALCGRVPVRVIGKCNKFDYLGLSEIAGVARSVNDDQSLKNKGLNIIARALENKNTEEEGLVLCIAKFEL